MNYKNLLLNGVILIFNHYDTNHYDTNHYDTNHYDTNHYDTNHYDTINIILKPYFLLLKSLL